MRSDAYAVKRIMACVAAATFTGEQATRDSKAGMVPVAMLGGEFREVERQVTPYDARHR
jgi:hypothetical protein